MVSNDPPMKDKPLQSSSDLLKESYHFFRVPPNCQFELDDIEQPWTWKDNTADFIFSRDLILSIRDFPRLIDQCYRFRRPPFLLLLLLWNSFELSSFSNPLTNKKFLDILTMFFPGVDRHLKPGGWLEFHCIVGLLQCDDGTLLEKSTFQKWSNLLGDACAKFGTPIDDPTRWAAMFDKSGFDNVTQEVFKVPCGPWAKDKRLKLIGMWEHYNLMNHLEGLTMRLFQKGLGWSEDEIRVFSALLRKDLRDMSVHAYWP